MTCRLKCCTNVNLQARNVIFQQYWGLGNLQLQREFIAKMITDVTPQYRYQREGSNNVEGKKIRVCKKFFKATLDITDCPIRTVLSKNNNGFLEADGRGEHGNHKKVDLEIKEGIRSFINRIPRVESHYTRSKSTREYIEGNKSIAGIYGDCVQDCATKKVPCGNSTMFHRIFNYEFNISFFSPKKDQCELCTAYQNAQNEEKDTLKVKYSVHLKEKELSRAEREG